MKTVNMDKKFKDGDGVIDPDAIENHAKTEKEKIEKEIKDVEKDSKTEK